MFIDSCYVMFPGCVTNLLVKQWALVIMCLSDTNVPVQNMSHNPRHEVSREA